MGAEREQGSELVGIAVEKLRYSDTHWATRCCNINWKTCLPLLSPQSERMLGMAQELKGKAAIVTGAGSGEIAYKINKPILGV